jgi:hypothetical protein
MTLVGAIELTLVRASPLTDVGAFAHAGRTWPCRGAAPSEHDESVRSWKASEAIHRREFVLRDPCRTKSAKTVHAAMVGDITPTRGGSEKA